MCYYPGKPLYYDEESCVHHFDKWAGGKFTTCCNPMEECEVSFTEEERVDFMNKNANFLKVNDEKEQQACIDKYIANILYQEIFAKQVD